MSNPKAILSFLFICASAYGCAAPAAREGAPGDEAVGQSEALTESNLLALGDSIAFGYNPFGDFTKVKNFTGYPEVLDDDYDGVKNASCPGETSASIFSTTAPDNGCRAYRAAYPLHVNYGNKPTQLDYALSKLQDPTDQPALITLNVSGNDFFLLEAQCGGDPTCIANGVPGVISGIAQNVGTIFSRIRGQGGYQGRLVYMNLYSTNFNDANSTGVVAATNNVVSQVARSFGAQIADAFGAFFAASGSSHDPCAAGLLIPLPTTGCDVHPSALGTEILAQTVRDAQ